MTVRWTAFGLDLSLDDQLMLILGSAVGYVGLSPADWLTGKLDRDLYWGGCS
jgi:hypothetical protein